MENHAEIKDRCEHLESRLEQLASDIRDIPFSYKLVEYYTSIDEELFQTCEWYEKNKEMLRRYESEREKHLKILGHLDTNLKKLDNEVQNTKSQASFHVPL